MQRVILRRLIQLPLLLLSIGVVAWFVIQLVPGGPLAVYSRGGMSPAALDALSERLGLNDPLLVQFGRWLGAAVQLDFGFSFHTRNPVVEEVLTRLPATLYLMVPTFLLVLLLSVLVGTFSAIRQYSRSDVLITTASFAGAAMPVYWLSLVLILINAAIRNPTTGRPFFPTGGMTTPGQPLTIPDVSWHLALPMIALGLGWVSWYSRYVRSSMLDVIHQDYVRTARAKGLRERAVIFKHAFKNAGLPLVTVIALDLPYLFAGALFVEIIFGWPGIGNFFYQSVVRRDYPVVLMVILVIAFLVIISNLLADIAYAWLDPRVRYQRRST